jgi:hypothetical protein
MRPLLTSFLAFLERESLFIALSVILLTATVVSRSV